MGSLSILKFSCKSINQVYNRYKCVLFKEREFDLRKFKNPFVLMLRQAQHERGKNHSP
jgi:hypothetical protein